MDDDEKGVDERSDTTSESEGTSMSVIHTPPQVGTNSNWHIHRLTSRIYYTRMAG